MMHLSDLHCTGYDPAVRSLTAAETAEMLPQIPAWTIVQDATPRLERIFSFETFMQALDFANKVGAMAEAEGHHPALLIEWGRVRVQWWTHFVGGLHLNDFIAAARTDRLYSG
jgi:4a-hydroxytetrahydrobiopterin dehydratase